MLGLQYLNDLVVGFASDVLAFVEAGTFALTVFWLYFLDSSEGDDLVSVLAAFALRVCEAFAFLSVSVRALRFGGILFKTDLIVLAKRQTNVRGSYLEERVHVMSKRGSAVCLQYVILCESKARPTKEITRQYHSRCPPGVFHVLIT